MLGAKDSAVERSKLPPICFNKNMPVSGDTRERTKTMDTSNGGLVVPVDEPLAAWGKLV